MVYIKLLTKNAGILYEGEGNIPWIIRTISFSPNLQLIRSPHCSLKAAAQ
jgi:hypothetical protein